MVLRKRTESDGAAYRSHPGTKVPEASEASAVAAPSTLISVLVTEIQQPCVGTAGDVILGR